MQPPPPPQPGAPHPGASPTEPDAVAPGEGPWRGPDGDPAAPEPLRTGPDPVRSALEALLDDESEAVWDGLRRTFREETPELRAVARRAARGERARARGRARRILAFWERRRVRRRLLRHVVRPRLDLERALLLLGRLERPDLDARPYVRALDAMGREVAGRIRHAPDDLSRPLALVEYLRERGFTGDVGDYHHPDNIHLHRAIERRQGMPLTLTAIHLFVARRAGIRGAAVPLPGHVFLRLYAGRRSVLVDPFHGGELRTRRDLLDYLAQHGLVPQSAWFRDADDAHLFHRHLLNLAGSYRERGRGVEAAEVQEIAGLLARTRPSRRRPRAETR